MFLAPFAYRMPCTGQTPEMRFLLRRSRKHSLDSGQPSLAPPDFSATSCHSSWRIHGKQTICSSQDSVNRAHREIINEPFKRGLSASQSQKSSHSISTPLLSTFCILLQLLEMWALRTDRKYFALESSQRALPWPWGITSLLVQRHTGSHTQLDPVWPPQTNPTA